MVFSHKKFYEKDINLIPETERHDYLVNKTTGKAIKIPVKVKIVLKKFHSFNDRALFASNILGMAIHYLYNLIELERIKKLKEYEKYRIIQVLCKFLRISLLSPLMDGYFTNNDVKVLINFLSNCPHGYELGRGYIMVNTEFLPLIL
jgi:hypothetical protein